MSHFAELNENNVVLRVLVCDNDDPNDDEGYQWLIDNLGGRWVQTSYNGNFRGCFAGIGFTYDEELDVFKAPIRNPRQLNPNMIPPTSQENTTVYTFGDDENVT
jgi:hypothetical protein